MNRSRFSKEEKLKILGEKELDNISVEEVCVRYRISMPTYYNWKRELKHKSQTTFKLDPSSKIENQTLRRLYFDLSEHNYQLAKFLNK